MQISSINNSSSQFKNNNVGFKSAIPVVFWEKVGGKYEIVQDITKIERMQDILVRRANGTGGKSDEAMQERFKVMSLLYGKDRDYRLAFDKNIIPGNVFIKFADGIKRLVKLRLSN